MNKTLLLMAAALAVAGCDKQPSIDIAGQEQKSAATRGQVMQSSGIDVSGMDKTVAAAADMFQHTNGQWVKDNQIPADKARWGTFNVLAETSRKQMKAIIENASQNGGSAGAQQIADLYNSYMDVDKIETLGLKPLAAQFSAIDQLASIAEVVSFWADSNIIGGASPVSFWVYADQKDPNTNVVYVSQGGLGLPDRDYYFDQEDKAKETRQRYTQYLTRLKELAGLSGDVDKVMALETAIAKEHWSKVKNRDSDLTYNKVATADLNQWMASLGNGAWQNFLSAADVSGQANYFVYQPSYFKALGDIANASDLATWQLYLKLHLLDGFAPELNKDLVDARFDFRSGYLNGVEKQQPRWKLAVNVLNNSLGELLGQEYVAKHFPPEAKKRMKTLVDNLLAAYSDSIKKLDWMGAETKIAAQDKLDKFRTKIGYPDKWRDYSALELKADDLIGNMMRASKFEHDFMINDLRKPVDRDRWHMSPQTVNAYFNPVMNEIVFPAAILQPPFFDLNSDDAVNYGAIGGVIGHEIGHGFDDQGAKYDGDGRLRNWWTEQDLEQFQARTKKLIEQYNQFEVLPGVHVNGELTIGENIGDLGGLSIAYKAYKMSLQGQASPSIDGFTGEQRVFLGWTQAWRSNARDEYLLKQVKTDPHSPAIFRVNGVMPNIDEFYQAFDVKPGDKMYLPPEERVKIWK